VKKSFFVELVKKIIPRRRSTFKPPEMHGFQFAAGSRVFYSPDIGSTFRMGDIVRGFVLGTACQSEPSVGVCDYQVNLRSPNFAVILTPCCSMGDKTLTLAPLVRINPKWRENPYFSSDLTNINREMLPEQTMSPATWQKLGDNERKRRLERGRGYALVEWFIFPPHPTLGTYTLKDTTFGYFAIDFRSAHRVECEAVVSTKQVPITAKVLELEIGMRNELRNKVSFYYGRVPQEDVA